MRQIAREDYFEMAANFGNMLKNWQLWMKYMCCNLIGLDFVRKISRPLVLTYHADFFTDWSKWLSFK